MELGFALLRWGVAWVDEGDESREVIRSGGSLGENGRARSSRERYLGSNIS